MGPPGSPQVSSHVVRRSLFSDIFIPAKSRNISHPRKTDFGVNILFSSSNVGKLYIIAPRGGRLGPRLGVSPSLSKSAFSSGVPRGLRFLVSQNGRTAEELPRSSCVRNFYFVWRTSAFFLNIGVGRSDLFLATPAKPCQVRKWCAAAVLVLVSTA